MIYFYCPECEDGLEAEDAARGSRMTCPACSKEIEVPQKGVKRPSALTLLGKVQLPGAKFLAIVLVLGLAGLIGFRGIGYFVEKARREANAPEPCSICVGKADVPCARCRGAKNGPCGECAGSGNRKNFRDEVEKCYVCTGSGKRDCATCGGLGVYSCAACSGTGVRGGKP